MRRLKKTFFVAMAAFAWLLAAARLGLSGPLLAMGFLGAFVAAGYFLLALVRVGLALRFAAEARRKDWVVDDREVADLFADGLHFCLHPPPHRDDVVNCPYFQERDSDIHNLAAIMLTLDPSEIANLSPGERGGGTEAWRKAKRRIALPSPRQLFRLTTVPRTRRAVEKLERAAAGAPRGANALTAAGRIALPPRHDPGGRERA